MPYMALSARALHPLFGAEIEGIDLSGPLKAGEIAEFREIMDRYAVGVIRHARPLGDAAHVGFSRLLGPLLPMKMLTMLGKSKSRFSFPELIDIGNIDADGKLLPEDDRRRAYNRGNLLWHTDASYDQQRGLYSLLSAHVVPPGGGAPTEFVDMRAAYDALPSSRKKLLEGLEAEHSIWHSRALAGMSDVSAEEKATRPAARHRLVHLAHLRRPLDESVLARGSPSRTGTSATRGRGWRDSREGERKAANRAGCGHQSPAR